MQSHLLAIVFFFPSAKANSKGLSKSAVELLALATAFGLVIALAKMFELMSP